jgi:hypothetical protein
LIPADFQKRGAVRRRRTALAAAAGVALCAAALAGAKVATAGTGSPAAVTYGVWHNAIEVPGTAALNTGGGAGVNSVSCAIGGTCAAGGSYTDSSKFTQAFVVDETVGKWDTATEVPGTARLNAGGAAAIVSVSCAAAGDCGAGGYYADSSGHWQAFVADETGGVWGTATKVLGIAALNAGGHAQITSMSCPAVGQCSAGGIYTDGSGDQQAFVVSETSGTWGTAEEVPGTAGLNVGGHAAITSVSCAAAGTCSAGGYYAYASVDGIPNEQAFVVDETSGTWGMAKEVPGTAALNGGGFAQITSMSCPGVGECTAGGLYTSSKPDTQAFVVSQTNGVWQTATVVPGITVLNTTGFSQVNTVSCATPGNCVAGGFYQDSNYLSQSFLVSETNGVWGTAEETPGTAALNTGTTLGASTSVVSCGGAGNCSAGGYYTDGAGRQQVFVISESAGVWGTAVEMPGTAALNTGPHAAVSSISCPTTNACTAGGHYSISLNASGEAYVIRETKGG